MWAKGRKVTVIVCLAISAVALAQKQVSSSHIARPELATEHGSFSFRGLQVAVGETGPGHDIVVRNSGDSPMRGLNAVTHGDFVITASSCAQTLEPAGGGKDACSISVAFRPTKTGRTSGDLTVQAAGVRAQVVPLDAGTPINFPTVQPGATALQWVELPSGTTAVSGTVTGPFAIALQTSYVYGSINGVAFDSSASSDGVCATGVTPCGVYLGVEFLGTSSLGETTGTVTLSNGLTYSLSANVLGPGLLLTPTSLDGGSILVGSTSASTPLTASITNFGSTVITLGQPGVSGPFIATNGCGTSLAAGATCTISVLFAPTAIGAASGELQVPSSVGDLDASLTGTGLDNPADVQIDPAVVTFPISPTSFTGTQTVTLKNLSAVDSVHVGALSAPFSWMYPCPNSAFSWCVDLVANNCVTLAPLATCQVQLKYQGASGEYPYGGTLLIPLTPSSSGTASTYSIPFNAFVQSAPTPSALAVSPSVLQFPTTPFGQPSAPQTVTVTNLSQSTVGINVPTVQDFAVDPPCGPLLPGRSCDLTVRYLPTSGVPQGSGGLTINTFDLAVTTPYPTPIGSAVVSVSGFGTPAAASVASPGYPPLIQPLNVDLAGGSVEISNNSATPLVLSSIIGNGTPADATGCSPSIPPGGSCTVKLFMGCGQVNCQLTVYSNAPSSPDIYAFNPQGGGGCCNLWFDGAGGGPFVFPHTTLGASTGVVYSLGVEGEIGLDISMSVVPNLSDDFTIDDQCPAVLKMHVDHSLGGFQGGCSVGFTFAPKTLGFHWGTVTFSTTLEQWTFVIAGTAVSPPALQVTPTSLVLGSPVGQTATGTVTLTNTSAAALSLSPAELAGPQAADFKISETTCGSSLAAGAACTIQVTYTNPESLSSAELILTSGINDIQTVTLTGVVPVLYITKPLSAFLTTSIGYEAHQLFTLTSFQGAPITMQNVAITGANASDYKIASNGCAAGFVVQGTLSCVIDVAFAPLEIGVLTANLAIVSSAGTSNWELYGAGAVGPAQVSPTKLIFGNQDVLISSAAQLITLTNPNPQALTLPALPALSGANPSDFKVTGNCTSIPANSACSLNVVFIPSASGTRTASLAIGTATMVDPVTQSTVPANTTVNFTGSGFAILTPTMTVTPDASSITTAQPLTVTVAVNGATGNPTPTGTVTLTSGTYTSAPSDLTGGSATINVPAGSLTVGTDILTAGYTPGSGSSSTYNSATGTATVKVALPPLTATPGFSPVAGTYTSIQSVTLNATTPGASIYYTTDGTNPTTASVLYSGPITVSKSETIAAFATATGYEPSPVVTAQYIINLPPPTFTITGTGVTVARGASTGNTSTITVTPAGSFAGSIALTAAVTASPSGAVDPPTLSFGTTTPIDITAANPGTATLRISTTAATSAALNHLPRPGNRLLAASGAVLACIILIGIPANRRRWQKLLGILILFIAMANGLSACAGGAGGRSGGGGGNGNPGTTPGNYTITVTGTSGTLTESSTITLIVN